MNRGAARVWPLAFWVLVIGGLVAAAVSVAWTVHARSRERIESVEPRFARLVGLGNDTARVKELTVQAQRAIERHAYPVTRDVSQAGNDAQQRVRDLFSKAGLEVVSIQVLPVRGGDKSFDRIPITLRADGELSAVQASLAALPSLAPSVFVEGFSIQGASMSESAPARVVLELQLHTLRARS